MADATSLIGHRAGDPAAAAAGSAAPGWEAALKLRLASRAGRSVLVTNTHRGPLRVQKALYPEGEALAQLLLVHPPGGIAGGDRLSIEVQLEAQSQALITTPGAGKWYKSAGRPAQQSIRLQVAHSAGLEWLPQESLYFNGCEARQHWSLDCEPGARACGWEISVLGRRASAERFLEGSLHQDLEVWVGGRLWWLEQTRLSAGDALLDSPLGWDGFHVFGLFWALGLGPERVETCRHLKVPAPLTWGITAPRDGLILARVLGDSAARVRAVLAEVWALLRPALMGRNAVPPRIWST